MTAPAALSSADAATTGALTPRALLRLAALGAWTAACASVWALGAWAGGWRWTTACRRRWAQGGLRLLGVRRRVTGAVPPGGFLLVSNHLSYLDVLVLSAELPVRFVAKREVATWPVWGPLARWTGTLFIDRAHPRDARRVADAVGAALARGESVAIFPEGTSSPGDEVLPFRSALFEGTVAAGTNTVPAALSYRVAAQAPTARTSVCWWGEMEFLPHLVALAGLDAIDAALVLGPPLVPETERRTLADRAHAAVAALHREAQSWEPSEGRMHVLDQRIHDADVVARANAALLRQGMVALSQMEVAQFRTSPRPDASPIGAHFRHVLEHYQAFLDGLDGGRVDYDARPREAALEQDIELALSTAEEVALRLDFLEERPRWRQLFINAASEAGLTDRHDWTASTVGRELGFLLSHTIHHYALIKLLAADHGLMLDADFGVAPSTLRHRALERA